MSPVKSKTVDLHTRTLSYALLCHKQPLTRHQNGTDNLTDNIQLCS